MHHHPTHLMESQRLVATMAQRMVKDGDPVSGLALALELPLVQQQVTWQATGAHAVPLIDQTAEAGVAVQARAPLHRLLRDTKALVLALPAADDTLQGFAENVLLFLRPSIGQPSFELNHGKVPRPCEASRHDGLYVDVFVDIRRL